MTGMVILDIMIMLLEVSIGSPYSILQIIRWTSIFQVKDEAQVTSFTRAMALVLKNRSFKPKLTKIQKV